MIVICWIKKNLVQRGHCKIISFSDFTIFMDVCLSFLLFTTDNNIPNTTIHLEHLFAEKFQSSAFKHKVIKNKKQVHDFQWV